jgi:hypothetical protein
MTEQHGVDLHGSGWGVRLAAFGALLAITVLAARSPALAAGARRPGGEPCVTAPALVAGERAGAPVAAADGAAWLALSLRQGQAYSLSVEGGPGLRLRLHAGCAAGAASDDLPGSLTFTALRDGVVYLEITRDVTTAASERPAVAFAEAPAPSAVAQVVPPDLLRRASEFLEEWRGSHQAPEWADAQLSRQVRLLFRPDMEKPAYYEFKVERLDPAKEAFVPAGFIELAAGEHDYPVSRWDFTGLTPTEEAEQLAPGGSTILRYYKLDTLAYVVEYQPVILEGLLTAGTEIANLGDLPNRIVGLDAIPQQAAPLIDESVDPDAEQRVDPARLPNLQQEAWPSWDALKTGYAATYAPMLASLVQRSAPAWKLERDRAQIGETLVKGDVRSILALPNGTLSGITVTGAGSAAAYLKQEQLTDGGQTTGLRLTVLAEPADRTTLLDVNVLVQYTGGLSETVKYNIANSAALVASRVYLPLVQVPPNARGAATASGSAGDATLSEDWGPWRYWWADGDASTIRYGQFDYGGCKSGCGGTSWAMAFAWVDRRAAENHPTWGSHWGLYREGGGLGANAVAPLNQDAGVQSMTTQLRNTIGTFCAFGSGATFPWRMIDAANYVRPRATAAWAMQTRYDPTGLCWFGACDGSRDLARNQIVSRRAPAVVGTGWLSHYPLAFGYAERSKRSCFLFICSTSYSRWFYVNNGWYGSNNGWTSADVWFGGIYRPR